MEELKNKFFENIDLRGGKVILNDFIIDPGVSFEEQEFSFKRDIIQIKIGRHYIIDMGCYREFDPKGSFIILLIKDHDWIKPILKKRCRRITTLQKYLPMMIDLLHIS